MSIYDEAADKAKKQLDEISPTMCYAKWSQVSMHLTNGKTHSCYHPPTHSIDVNELKTNPSALHNTKEKKEQRALMLKGERPEGCSYCWNIEDTGARSDRVYRSGEYWAQNAREEIAEAGADGNINPRYVEVNFNQALSQVHPWSPQAKQNTKINQQQREKSSEPYFNHIQRSF